MANVLEILARDLQVQTAKAYNEPSFNERNRVMGSAIAKMASSTISLSLDNPQVVRPIQLMLEPAVIEAGDQFQLMSFADAARKARPIALKYLPGILAAGRLEAVDMRGVLDQVDVPQIVPLAIRELELNSGPLIPDQIKVHLAQYINPEDSFYKLIAKIGKPPFGTKNLTSNEANSLAILLQLSHATYIIRKIHQAADEGNTAKLETEQWNPYPLMVSTDFRRHLGSGKNQESSLVLTAWNMYKDCRRSTGDSLSSML